jgi:hypothetical protein
VPRLLAAAHALREDLLHDPGQGNHAHYIGSSRSAYIAAEDGLENVSDYIQAWRSCDFGIPVGEVIVAVLLCLWDVEDFVLDKRDEKMLLPAFHWERTYKIWHWDGLID